MVFTYDFQSNAVVIRPIVRKYKNWTQHLVDINLGGEIVKSTRQHRFWVESQRDWLTALELRVDMTLRSVDDNLVAVQFTKTYAAESTTYNFEVEQTHNYFVGTTGVLVHNGERRPDFTNLTKRDGKIYHIYDWSSGKKELIYVGQTFESTVEDRLAGHLQQKPEWRWKHDAELLRVQEIHQGSWTFYEASVWEKHFIDLAKQGGWKLENKPDPISWDNYYKYKYLHDPCL